MFEFATLRHYSLELKRLLDLKTLSYIIPKAALIMLPYGPGETSDIEPGLRLCDKL